MKSLQDEGEVMLDMFYKLSMYEFVALVVGVLGLGVLLLVVFFTSTTDKSGTIPIKKSLPGIILIGASVFSVVYLIPQMQSKHSGITTKGVASYVNKVDDYIDSLPKETYNVIDYTLKGNTVGIIYKDKEGKKKELQTSELTIKNSNKPVNLRVTYNYLPDKIEGLKVEKQEGRNRGSSVLKDIEKKTWKKGYYNVTINSSK